MMPSQKHFLQRITSLRGAHNLAVILHTISALALRAPRAAFTINAFAKASV
jgi:hypothetical protein